MRKREYSPRKKGERNNRNRHMRSSTKPLVGNNFQSSDSVEESLESTFFIQFYARMCRGLQLRNWNRVCSQLKFLKCSKETIQVLYNSWVKFKFARMIRPHMSQTYVYILKHCSDLDGQRVYDDVYEQFTEQPEETTFDLYRKENKSDLHHRLAHYFYNEQPEWILPLTVFPRIDFKKTKMNLAFEPYEISGDQIKEVHEKVFNFVYKLGIKNLFIPRGDLMQKYSTQRYNDGGVVRFDYERPTNTFDSSFKYQRFLTRPLTPREVWLPGKAIKQNNSFFMNVHRQILKRDERYPTTDFIKVHQRLLPHLKRKELMKFDISGFGFQFLRELLKAGNNAIRELYPCSEIEEQGHIFDAILDNVKVEMTDGSFVYPPRGIGLGYYEDLKTIVMLALLDQDSLVSAYGDQGLLDYGGVSFAQDLMSYSFIMNHEKIDIVASEGQLRWGGIIFNEDGAVLPRRYSDCIFGSFFSLHHWERKSTLYSVFKHYPDMYKSIEKRLIDAYDRIYGYEFFKGDNKLSFVDGGLSSKSRVTGVQRLYNIRCYQTPISTLTYDPIYQTPFNLIGNSKVSYKDSKNFQIKRKKIYKFNTPQDTDLFDYVNPIIEYNAKVPLEVSKLPRWADLNMILFDGRTSGAITCGLSGEEITNAVLRQHFSSDPFRARATGGYSFTTKWRSERPPPQELLESAEILRECESIDSLYVNRTDLVQDPSMGQDSMYYNDDISGVISKVSKRKFGTSIAGNSTDNRLVSEVRQNLPSLIKRHKVNDLADIITYAKDMLQSYDDGYTIASSHHGDLDADDDYYADAIDLVDL